MAGADTNLKRMTPPEISAFAYEPGPIRVICAAGAIGTLPDELARLSIAKPMVLTTPSGGRRYADLLERLKENGGILYGWAEPHSPEQVSLAALGTFHRSGCDGLVSIGGGSTTGLGKFLAAATGKPLIAIPTTLAGSDMTPVYGWKADGVKHTRIDPRAQARTVLYDANLYLGLPAGELVRSAMNCLAHLVEALYPATPNMFAADLATIGMRVLFENLPVAVRNPTSIAAREQLCYAAFLGGHLVAIAGIGLHHKICHLIGGVTDISHGDNNSVVLPHVVALNAPYLGREGAILYELFGEHPGSGLRAWAIELGAPSALALLGLREDVLPMIVDPVLAHPPANPAPLDRDVVTRLVEGIRAGKILV
ncbi:MULTISPECIES: iron-containing alcohol dehydrogenase [Sphingobium]|uniref:Uncharacterized protein n=1 Tax=Sphingobium ummariense RL-3 TaxID=1346791 RepID=T0K063_9SPHN|nr:iron-containing alcohol dehydrogenase [Sphingobium ummariense]EQB29904.1 hypothetical protein M529_22525 [Sphingobium ummariense RL-3]